jgi:hypothetical protein
MPPTAKRVRTNAGRVFPIISMKRLLVLRYLLLATSVPLQTFGETYSDWATRQQLTEAERAPQQALATDGTPNAWKYVLAVDPKTPLPASPFSPLIATTGGSQYFAVQFTRSRATEGVQYGLSASDDLRTWRDVEAALEKVQDLPDGMQVVRVMTLLPLGNTESQYYRPSVRLNSRAVPLLTGPPVSVAWATIPPSGAEILLDNQAGPLAGLQVIVPAGAYSNSLPVQISYRPILENPLPDKITPVTPLITIENGGEYSQEPMSVQVPIQITTNEFANGLLVRSEDGRIRRLAD